MMEAVSCAVPIVCIPFNADQPGNCVRTVLEGSAVALHKHDFTLAQLSSAVEVCDFWV